MAKNKRARRAANLRVEASLDVLTEPMRDHVRGLGIATCHAYLAWCRRNQFAPDVLKGAGDRQRERLHALRKCSEEFSSKHRRVRNPVQTVRRILAGDRFCVPLCYLPIAEVMASSHPHADACGRRELLVAVLSRVCVVAPGLLHAESVGLRTMLRMLDHWRLQLRDVADWTPTTRNEERALVSLIHHVFARFPPAACLTRSWFDEGQTAEEACYRDLYLHCAQGNNLRTATLPIEYTRKMAHWFDQAPDDASVGEALRFGQVLGLGGSRELAEAIGATRLSREFGHDPFWRTVIQFFVRHDIAAVAQVAATVDYLYEQRIAVDAFVDEHGQPQQVPPPQPNLCMQGRCPRVLQRHIDAWHARLGRTGGGADRRRRWAPSGIAGYREVEASSDKQPDGANRIWLIRELCSGAELRHEGNRMAHCVFSYARACEAGHTKIFSLRCQQGDRVRHIATIEVRARAIAQVRARRNEAPCRRSQAIVRRWADAVSLSIRKYAW